VAAAALEYFRDTTDAADGSRRGGGRVLRLAFASIVLVMTPWCDPFPHQVEHQARRRSASGGGRSGSARTVLAPKCVAADTTVAHSAAGAAPGPCGAAPQLPLP
jgi:hypothetical protein